MDLVFLYIKKKTIIVGLLVFAYISIVSCEKKIDTQDGSTDVEFNLKELALVESGNEFGLDLFKRTVQNEATDKNIFVSPTSISIALAMTYNGADEETKLAFENVLKLNGLTVDEINLSYQSLINILTTIDNDVLLKIANSIWYRDTYFVEPNFLDVNSTYYNAEVSALNFENPQSVDIINDWVSQNTNDLIPEIVDEISPNTIMFLINAIYFKGTWTYEFDIDNTFESPFYLQNGNSVSVPTMNQTGEFNYFANEQIEILELPYGNANYSMLIILPKPEIHIDSIVSLMDENVWEEWINNLLPTEDVHVYLPRFKFEYEKTLNEILIDMGLGIAFSGAANFSKINPNNELFISKVKHKSFIEVNEEGTEAAAVTSVEINLTSVNGVYFNANRPFIFAIKEANSKAIVFIGKFAKP